MDIPKRGPGRPPVPDDERSTPYTVSVRPSTIEKLKAIADAYSGAKVSASFEGIVEDAYIQQIELGGVMQPQLGFAPMHGTRILETLRAHPAYTIWSPKLKAIGYRHACGCEIRGDGSSYAWVPCEVHRMLAEAETVGDNVREKPIAHQYRGGFLRPFSLPLDRSSSGLSDFQILERRKANLIAALAAELSLRIAGVADVTDVGTSTVITVSGSGVRISDTWLAVQTNAAELDYAATAKLVVDRYMPTIRAEGVAQIVATGP